VIRASQRARNAAGRRALPLQRCFLAIGLLVVVSGCGSFVARGYNAEGVRSFQQAQYQLALTQFGEAIHEDPANPDGYYNLAATYHRIGKTSKRQTDLDQAESFYNQCLDHDPEHRDCYRGLAVLLVEENRTQEAFRLIEGWAGRQPASADARIELARLNEECGDKKSAQDHLVEALTIEPNNARALAALGKIREELGQRAQAVANYQRSLYLNPFQPELAAHVAALQQTDPTVAAVTAPQDDPLRTVNRDSLQRR
jgi:tetratricopeptide (TPR) repeat protein